MSGHDHHFLSRLDRVSGEQAELALALYRDDGLLRLLMQTCGIGDEAERIAISLGSRERGPFLIVARDGGFVTCLGEGMSPGPWPVISRGRLDTVAKNVKHLNDKIAYARRMGGNRRKGLVAQLIERIKASGPGLCREDFQAAMALQPVLVAPYMMALMDAGEAASMLRERMAGYRRSTPALEEGFRTFYELTWATGHFSVLVTSEPQRFWDGMPEEIRDELPKIAWIGLRSGCIGPALRALWSAARLGKIILPRVKYLHTTSATDMTFWAYTGALAAIGMRHAKLRAEVSKALSMPSFQRGGEALAARMLRHAEPLMSRFHACLDNIDREVAVAQQFARIIAQQTLEEAGNHQYPTPDDVPLDLARLGMCTNSASFLLDGVDSQLVMAAYLPWAVRLDAADLYPTRAELKLLDQRWTPQVSLDLLAGVRAYNGVLPLKAKPKPGPNHPCPCHSGKKYKKCCGRPGVAPPGASDELAGDG